jgi:hypothetical protein
VPAGTDVRQTSDELIKLALEVEDQFLVTSVTKVMAREGS